MCMKVNKKVCVTLLGGLHRPTIKVLEKPTLLLYHIERKMSNAIYNR